MAKKAGNKADLGKYLTDRNIFILLFIASLALRIIFVNEGIPHFDSIADANKAPLTISTGKLQYSYGYGSPGIVVLLTAAYYVDHLVRGATNAEFAYFFITLVTAALSISVLYLVAKKITGDRLIGIFSAVLFCVTPIYLSVTTYPKTHGPGEFFSLLAGYYLLRAADKGNDELKNIIISGLLFSFAISIRVFSFFYIIPFLIFYANPMIVSGKKISFNKGILDKKNIFWFLFSVLIIVFILFIPRLLEVGAGGFINILLGERKTVAWQGAMSDRLSFALSQLHRSVTWLGWAAGALGIYYLYRKNKVALAALAVWFFMFFIYFGNLRGVEARFLTSALIAILILAACGCKLLYNSNRILGLAVVIGLVVWMFTTIYPVLEYRHNYSGQKEFALWAGSMTEPNSILISTDEGFFYEFYTGKKFIGHYYSGSDDEIANFIDILHNYLQKGVPVYMAQSGIGYDPDGRFTKELLKNFDVYVVGSKTNEAYSQNTLQLQLYDEKLFKLVEKSNPNGANQQIQ
ncbi:hypothetical protein COV19_05720 [Candidatus Woesearchaeota archaeon CG10_big_fil_rev_8_21_14_0_10_44_13]|nr:MAG: hypothetical protein COV19_05720 [Candidatus Woesearchaeota archaeon CG10_big_fil_rev_8_21_14_0_10_44_13]